jgi:hypothetical protein
MLEPEQLNVALPPGVENSWAWWGAVVVGVVVGAVVDVGTVEVVVGWGVVGVVGTVVGPPPVAVRGTAAAVTVPPPALGDDAAGTADVVAVGSAGGVVDAGPVGGAIGGPLVVGGAATGAGVATPVGVGRGIPCLVSDSIWLAGSTATGEGVTAVVTICTPAQLMSVAAAVAPAHAAPAAKLRRARIVP